MKRVLQFFVVAALGSAARTRVRKRRAPHVRRLPRRPQLPVRGASRRDARSGAGGEHHDRPDARHLGEHRTDPAGERRRPVRQGVQVQRPRRARAEHAGARHGGPDHDLGDAEVGERRQDAELHADEAQRPDRVLARCREPLLGPLPGLPVRALLLDLERVEPAALPGASVRREGEVDRAAELREARGRCLFRDQGRQLAGEGGGRQHLVGRPRQAARGQVGDAFAGPLRTARRRRQPAPEVRRVGAASVSGAGQPEAEPEGALAERDARVVPAVREVTRHVVQAQERPHLDHRVRPRGEVGRRAEGHHARAAGRLRGAGARARQGRSTDGHVHLVRLPRQRDERVAERSAHDERRREAVARAVHHSRALRRRAERDRDRQGRRREPDRDRGAARLRRRNEAGRDRRLQRQGASRRASSSRVASRPRRSAATRQRACACPASGR